MSNASNLSTLANVLDDGSSGQFLKSTGSGGVAFDTVAAGAVVYATADLLPLSGNSAGDMGYVTATNRFYINNGSGWYSVSLVNTNPNITSVQDASSGTTPFTLATDGTATVITVTAADPEDIPLTYGYSVTSGSLNGSTVTQGTGSNTNVFTVTPHASQDATFTLTFTASDGINQATSANAFSLSFVTTVADSNHTTLLATATGTSDNNNITDASTNSRSITVNGDAHAGTFSPYRSGGYSAYFDGTGDYLATTSSNYALGTSGAFTLELWYYFEDARTHTLFDSYPSGYVSGNGEAKLAIIAGGSGGSGDGIYLYGGAEVGNLLSVSRTFSVGVWEHFCWTRDTSGNHTFYINGTQIGTSTATPDIDINLLEFGRRGGSFNSTFMNGYLSDVRLVKGTAITPPSGGPTERLEAVTNTSLLTCHLPYIADGSTNAHTITVNGDVSTKPFSPYDYNEYSATDHGGSVVFDGTGDYLLTSALIPATGNFTIEGWVYSTSTDSSQTICGQRTNSGNGRFGIYIKSGGNISFGQTDSSVSGLDYTSSNSEALNKWCHFVLMRTSSNIAFYVNGERVLNTTSGTFEQTNFEIGTDVELDAVGLNYGLYGFVSDLRVSLSAKYSEGTSVTIPTTPLSSTGAALHIKGTDASIIDKSQGSNLKLIGDTTGSTTQVKFSNTKSMYFDGSGDYITAGADAGNFGTGDFTIETWLRASSWNKALFRKTTTTSSSSPPSISVYMTSATILTGVNSGAADGTWMSATNPFSLNTWGHFAITRVNGLVNVYADGSRIISTTRAVDVDNNITFRIGEWRNSTEYFTGYLQDFRITKGKARYTAADETANIPSAPLEG